MIQHFPLIYYYHPKQCICHFSRVITAMTLACFPAGSDVQINKYKPTTGEHEGFHNFQIC